MLVDAIASLILAGMMLIPLINLFVGIIAGAAVAGPAGMVVGIVLALCITAVEYHYCCRIEWPGEAAGDASADLDVEPTGPAVALSVTAVGLATIRTGPAIARRVLGRTGRPEPQKRTQISTGATLRRAR